MIDYETEIKLDAVMQLCKPTHDFIMLVGPPGSGKTSICEYITDRYDYTRVSPELIRKEFNTENLSNKELFSTVYNRLASELNNGNNIVYDATNCQAQFRNKIMSITEGCYSHATCLVMNTSLVDCLNRNQSYGLPVKEKVIEEMYLNLKKRPPSISEGYDVIITI